MWIPPSDSKAIVCTYLGSYFYSGSPVTPPAFTSAGLQMS